MCSRHPTSQRHFCPASADTIFYHQCMCLIGLGAFISWDLCFKYDLIVKVCMVLVNVTHYDGFHCVIKKKFSHSEYVFAPHIHCMQSVHVHLCVCLMVAPQVSQTGAQRDESSENMRGRDRGL